MAKINKSDLIRQTAKKTGMTVKDTEKVVNQFIDSIVDDLDLGYEVSIEGFMKLDTHEVAERTYHMPDGGTSIVPSHIGVSAHLSKKLKTRVNDF